MGFSQDSRYITAGALVEDPLITILTKRILIECMLYFCVYLDDGKNKLTNR